jgi:hypothetical protein
MYRAGQGLHVARCRHGRLHTRPVARWVRPVARVPQAGRWLHRVPVAPDLAHLVMQLHRRVEICMPRLALAAAGDGVTKGQAISQSLLCAASYPLACRPQTQYTSRYCAEVPRRSAPVMWQCSLCPSFLMTELIPMVPRLRLISPQIMKRYIKNLQLCRWTVRWQCVGPLLNAGGAAEHSR